MDLEKDSGHFVCRQALWPVLYYQRCYKALSCSVNVCFHNYTCYAPTSGSPKRTAYPAVVAQSFRR